MVFSSPFFLFIFLPVVFFMVFVSPRKAHNILLLIASILFYSWGNISHTLLFVFSITMNYFFGITIENATKQSTSRIAVTMGIIANLLLLVYFKYFNFLVDNINSVLSFTGKSSINHTSVILPVGISFFTFHALSYIIDVYRKKVKAQKNYLDLALYISFFPQLIAGPIVRYIDVSDQFKKRTISLEKISIGIQRFIFGLAKKIIVANSMAYIADQIFNSPTYSISSGVAWLGAIAYTFQIYFDFSGYSDMAIGLAKIFGFNFPENFNYPYSSQSIKEFWRRWHISLSTWFRDFLYIPLGGNRGGEKKTTINLLIVFFCTGFWHGASWSFIVWGMFHGTFLLIERIGFDKILQRFWMPLRVAYTLLIVMIGWVFFRAENLKAGIEYLKKMSFLHISHFEDKILIEYLDSKTIFLLVFSVLYSFRLYRWAIDRAEEFFKKRNNKNLYLYLFNTSKFLISLFLLFISLSYMASKTYSPFIYFRF